MIDADAVMEAQLEWLRAGGESKPRRVRNLERRLVKAVEKFEQCEKDLARAFNRWQKQRDEIKRVSKTLDTIAKETEA